MLGTFTANAVSQQVTYDNSELGGGFNAFQLRLAAPPVVLVAPSTYRNENHVPSPKLLTDPAREFVTIQLRHTDIA